MQIMYSYIYNTIEPCLTIIGSDNFVRLYTKDSSIVQSAKTSSESTFVLDWWSAKGGQQMQGEVENTSKMSRIYNNVV